MSLDRAASEAAPLLGLAVLLTAAAIGLLLLRRNLLFRRGATVACALRCGRARGWQGAVARFDPDAMRAYRALGLTMRPYAELPRQRLVLGDRRPATAGERSRLMADPVVLAVRSGELALELAVGTDALPGLLAWVEGRPVG